MSKAKTYAEWRTLAAQVDHLSGNDNWRATPKAKDYDHKLIAARLDHLRGLEVEGDVTATMFFIRTGLMRNLGGIGNTNLYRHAYLGTKALVEEYVREVVHQLKAIADSQDPNLQNFSKVEFFSEMLQTFGRTALILHGGASFGLCHLGVVKALHQQKMLPKIICGSYVGALTASLICCQEAEKLGEILNGKGISFEAFYQKNNSTSSFRRKLTRLLKHGRLFDIRVLERCARENIGDITFKEAFVKSGLVLNITVTSKRKNEVPVILNHLTAPDVVVWTAACASLATPGIYENVVLLVKRNDGTIVPWHPSAVKLNSARMVGEVPVKRLTELFNANNFIVSQVPSYLTWRPTTSDTSQRSFFGTITSLISKETWHRFVQLKEIGLIPDALLNIVNFLRAPMVGDIQITPAIYCTDIQYIFSNPDPAFVSYCIQKGEFATWKRLSHVEMRCAIEFALEKIISKLSS